MYCTSAASDKRSTVDISVPDVTLAHQSCAWVTAYTTDIRISCVSARELQTSMNYTQKGLTACWTYFAA